MHYTKKLKQFYFKGKSNLEFSNDVNEYCEIKISDLEDIVNRVHVRYPLISKSETALIIKGIFEAMRDLMIFGKCININKFVTDLLLYFYRNPSGIHKDVYSVKAKLQTSKALKGNKK